MKLPRLRVIVLVAMVVTTLTTIGWWIWGPPGTAVELVQRRWRLQIDVEQLRSEADSAWCDELPTDATNVTRRIATDPTGQRAEPDAHCRYHHLVWRRSWIVKAEGGPRERPQWPSPPLRVAPPGQPGSERLGKREAFYEVDLSDGGDHLWTCRVTPERWHTLREGTRWRVPVNRYGAANCAAMYESRL